VLHRLCSWISLSKSETVVKLRCLSQRAPARGVCATAWRMHRSLADAMVPSPRRMLARTYELLAFALPDKWHHKFLVGNPPLTQAPGALHPSERVRTLGKGAYGLVILGKDVQTGEQVSPFMYATCS